MPLPILLKKMFLKNWPMDDAAQRIVTVVYVHPHVDNEANATRFIKSLVANQPGYPCDVLVIVNGGSVTPQVRSLFQKIRGVQFFEHDDSGWDVGGYLALAKARTDLDLLFCCGGPTTFSRAGWLKKLMAAWSEYGPGMYGTNASYEVRPHLNTSGFLIPRVTLATYPHPVMDRMTRYEFEWGRGAFWRRVRRMGLRTMLVTWDGVWYPEEWRMPNNGYRDGDQSNCLTWFSHSRNFQKEQSGEVRRRSTELANGLHNQPPCKLACEVDKASPEKKLL